MRICWPQMVFILLVIAIGISGMLTGCGKKGPLYLPTEATPPVAAPPARHQPGDASDIPAADEKPLPPKKPSSAD